MPRHSLEETIRYFGERLDSEPPPQDLEEGVCELEIDGRPVELRQGKETGSLQMTLSLGLLVQPVPKERLKELATSNFLGVDTGGCTLEIVANGEVLALRANTTAGTSPQENWEWLHRIMSVAAMWNQELKQWDECVPLKTPTKEKEDVDPRTGAHWKV